jgi:hypothetical protein
MSSSQKLKGDNDGKDGKAGHSGMVANDDRDGDGNGKDKVDMGSKNEWQNVFKSKAARRSMKTLAPPKRTRGKTE